MVYIAGCGIEWTGIVYSHGEKGLSARQETVERSLTEAKQLHGHRYARMRGPY
jgi:hypothetical protein